MAIITEEPDQQQPKQSQRKSSKSSSTRKPPSITTPTKTSIPTPSHTRTANPNPNPFAFWFYFTLAVSFITLFFIPFPSLLPQDPKSWFLSLPGSLRQHYSKGRTIKVQTTPNQSPIEVFAIGSGPVASENVVIVHGLGLSSYSFRKVIQSIGSKGVHVVAIDLPGNGFSDKSTLEMDEGPNGFLGRFWDVYSAIQEKGFFWAFDQIIETGQIPYEEIQKQISKRRVVKPIGLGPEEIGRVLGQVIETIGLSPVHLVLHDSALGMAANWVSENSGAVRSITLIDTASISALPLWALGLPVVREVVLGSSFVYAKLIKFCCSKEIEVLDVEAHRVLLKGRGGRKAFVSMGRRLNHSFDIAEWGSLDDLKGIPMQVLWSSGWSKEWSLEGRRVADALPRASFLTHSGGRWPQEDAADEVAESIVRFVSSLPASVRKAANDDIPEHIQKIFDESKGYNGGDHRHHDHHHDAHGGHDHHDNHGHVHGAGYMDAYGLGHGW